MARLFEQLTVECVSAWFAQAGGTDDGYLRAHFSRFLRLREFASESLRPNSTILDVGAHWLHQAALLADVGHKMLCVDVPATLQNEVVVRQAALMGAELGVIKRLELGEGLDLALPDSVDAIIFAEILEHITFNPIPMWKALYSRLKEGGRIFITTPNSNYFRTVHKALSDLTETGRYGTPVDEVFDAGTYGHHWKEYSVPEIHRYFARLSPDFSVLRIEPWSPGASLTAERSACDDLKKQALPGIDFSSMVAKMERDGRMPFAAQFFVEIGLGPKASGIEISPPWIPD